MKNWNLTVNYIHGEQIAPLNSLCFQRIKKDINISMSKVKKSLLFLWVDSQAATAARCKTIGIAWLSSILRLPTKQGLSSKVERAADNRKAMEQQTKSNKILRYERSPRNARLWLCVG